MPHNWVPSKFRTELLAADSQLSRWECTVCRKKITFSAGHTPDPDTHVWMGFPDEKPLKLSCEEAQVWRVHNQ